MGDSFHMREVTMTEINKEPLPDHFRSNDGLVHAMREHSNYKAVCGVNRFVQKSIAIVDDPVTCVRCREVVDVKET